MKRSAHILVLLATSAAFTAMGYEIPIGDGTAAGASDFYLVPSAYGRITLKYASIPLVSLDAVRSGSWESQNRSVTAQAEEDGVTVLRFREFLGGEAATMKFSQGHLKAFVRQGDDAQREKDLRALTEHPRKQPTLAQLWRKRTDEQEQRRKAAWWKDDNRLHLGYFNPNATGTLFAEIAAFLASLAIVLRRHSLRIACCCVSLAALCALFMTGSRGAFMAFVAGLVTVSASSIGKRILRPRMLLAAFAALAIAAGAVVVAGKATDGRFGAKLLAFDPGNVQRIRAWRAAPEMMASAPCGWGKEPGRAYCDWFQDTGDSHKLYYLVNSHLTWLVQFGRLFRSTYTAVWLALFLVLLRFVRLKTAKVALGTTTTFAIALWFSTVGIFPTLWIIPAVCAAIAVVAIAHTCLRGDKRRNFRRLTAAALAGTAIGATTPFMLEAIGRSQSARRPLPVTFDGKSIKIGLGEPQTAILHDPTVLAGDTIGTFGHELRDWMAANKDYGVVIVTDAPSALPSQVERLVAAGRGAAQYLKYRSAHIADGNFCRAKITTFLSPQFSPDKIPYTLSLSTEASLVTGEFAAKLAPGDLYDKPWVTVVPGCELYIPGWPALATAPAKGGEK